MDFSSYWPSWPGRASSTLVLVDSNSTTVDDLFRLLFGANSPFQARARETRGFTNYNESEWVTKAESLPCLPGGFSWTCPAPANSEKLTGADFQFRMRKICFQSGRSLRTEELHRCVLAAPGQQYVIDCTVAVTAPFGDRFRTVCRYSIAAVTSATAQLRIDYAMTYAKPIPGWGRVMLEPAAESGLAKNFAQFIHALSDFIDISDAAVPVAPVPIPSPTPAPESPAVPSTAAPSTMAAHPPRVSHVTAILTAAGSQRRIRTVRTMFVDDHVVDLFLPVAEVLLLSAGISNSGTVPVRGAAALLSTASVLLLLQLLLNLWHSVGAACQGARSVPGALCARAHRAVDLPQSVAGVFVATVVIMVVRSLLGGIAAQMSQHSGSDAVEQVTPTAAAASPVSDSASTGSGAEISSHEIDTPLEPAECRPSVHMQRLGAVGNFLIFRWDRLGPRNRQREELSAGGGGGRSRGLDSAPDGANGGGHGERRAAASRRAGAEAVPQEAPPPPAFHPAGAVAFEMVFENERWQPFRGWGHCWPGHFLPTDSLRQWCDGSGGAAPHGSTLGDVAPLLPTNRVWVGEWRVDAAGVRAATCDSHGWFYSLNFQRLPFAGRTAGRHPMPCVRRRRWVRAHVPMLWEPVAPALVAALQPPELPSPERRTSSAVQLTAAARPATQSAPCAGATLPQLHSSTSLELRSQDAALRSARAAAAPTAARDAPGKHRDTGPQGAVGAAWSAGSGAGVTGSPCTPRSPHAKLDLRSVAPSEELGAVGVGDGEARKHQRTRSAPQVLRGGGSCGSLGHSSGLQRSISEESRTGPCGSPSAEPLGRAVASFPLEAAVGESATREGEVPGGATEAGSDAIDELLRTWSVRFYGAV